MVHDQCGIALIQFPEDALENRAGHPMPAIIATVQAAEGAVTNDDFADKPQTGSGKKAVE